jgi:hypothetical protein
MLVRGTGEKSGSGNHCRYNKCPGLANKKKTTRAYTTIYQCEGVYCGEEAALLALSYNQENQWKGCSSQLPFEISCRKGIFKSY